jgi:hypothetical protein
MVVKISPYHLLKIWTDNFTYNKLFITRRLQRSYALLSHNICPTFNLHNVMNNVFIPMYIGSILTEGKNSTSEGGGEDREVAVPGPPNKLTGPRLLRLTIRDGTTFG